mmetsp:Transcript_40945/g.80097  ORF Transcript_40945/g.80097 Transcript_40945/m.80097 type:complete len:133 (-) Transcript_40945:304-702(-)
MQARTLLATLSILQILAICLNSTMGAWVLFSTLPICALGAIMLWIAIWFRWKTGIWLFIVVSTALFGYGLARILTLVHHKEVSKHPLNFTWYTLQCIIEIMCIIVAIWVLNETHDDDDKKSDDKEEKKGLMG